jgi:plasmid stabilization system protein ParE
VRLLWTDRAISDISEIATHAPVRAERLVAVIEWLARSPFPAMYRGIPGRPDQHVLPGDPYVVIYKVDGDTLMVRSIQDGRRLRQGM